MTWVISKASDCTFCFDIFSQPNQKSSSPGGENNMQFFKCRNHRVLLKMRIFNAINVYSIKVSAHRNDAFLLSKLATWTLLIILCNNSLWVSSVIGLCSQPFGFNAENWLNRIYVYLHPLVFLSLCSHLAILILSRSSSSVGLFVSLSPRFDATSGFRRTTNTILRSDRHNNCHNNRY